MLKRRDGGAIYTLGRQPGTVIENNNLHDNIKAADIYLDEGSAGITVRRNTIAKAPGNKEPAIKRHSLDPARDSTLVIEDNEVR